MAKEATEQIPMWRELRYPDEDTFIRVAIEYPDMEGRPYHELPAWIRLGWPEELWNRVARTDERERWKTQDEKTRGREPMPWPIARKTWADAQKVYPVRPGIPDEEQDLYRVLHFWPDCFGQPLVDVELILKEGITINTLTYGPGHHRVPLNVATDLRFIDNKARQDYIDQFIPKKHQDRVIATFSMNGGGGEGEVRE